MCKVVLILWLVHFLNECCFYICKLWALHNALVEYNHNDFHSTNSSGGKCAIENSTMIEFRLWVEATVNFPLQERKFIAKKQTYQ